MMVGRYIPEDHEDTRQGEDYELPTTLSPQRGSWVHGVPGLAEAVGESQFVR
jgi:hypothetical protein